MEFVAFREEMTRHAENEFHAEHGDDNERASFQEMIALHELDEALGRKAHGENTEEYADADEHQLRGHGVIGKAHDPRREHGGHCPRTARVRP